MVKIVLINITIMKKSPFHLIQLSTVIMAKTTTKPKKSLEIGEFGAILDKLNKLDDTTKYALFGVGAFMLLIILCCIYRICCGGESDAEAEAEIIRRTRRSTGESHGYQSSHSGSRGSRTPAYKSPPREHLPSRERPNEWDQSGKDRKYRNERTTQDDQPSAYVDDVPQERGHHRRIRKATTKLRKLLRLTKEDIKRGSGAPSPETQTNILDALGSVEGTALTGRTATEGTGGRTAGTVGTTGTGGTSAPGYEPAVPYMQQTQGTNEAPRWY
ncbi:hypothetical protein RB195_007494 [Necator americanus]|uniref:Uncharacterized protein n=1 Tax=Necator americanus TaxID=51031 RepID=A0ABR1C009_NECAM